MLYFKCFTVDNTASFVTLTCGKNNVKRLIKLQLTSFFLHTEPINLIFIYQPVSFHSAKSRVHTVGYKLVVTGHKLCR